MDDLDWKKRFTHLFDSVWHPLITKLKQVNPKIIFMAEQAQWEDWGTEYYTKCGVDRVFAFRLRNAILSMDKKIIAAVADSTFMRTPPGKSQIVFIENHDMERYATAVEHMNNYKLMPGAALNILLGGTPSIYYGQEIGMQGRGGFNAFGNNDGNDIPRREAFEWYAMDTGQGLSVWYKNSGPWWDQRNLRPNDGISLEEEKKEDLSSLWHFYERLIAFRKKYPVLTDGKYYTIPNNDVNLFTFLRYDGKEAMLVAVNLADSTSEATVDFSNSPVKPKKAVGVFRTDPSTLNGSSMNILMSGYGVSAWTLH
jgi:glycosidase